MLSQDRLGSIFYAGVIARQGSSPMHDLQLMFALRKEGRNIPKTRMANSCYASGCTEGLFIEIVSPVNMIFLEKLRQVLML